MKNHEIARLLKHALKDAMALRASLTKVEVNVGVVTDAQADLDKTISRIKALAKLNRVEV